MKGFEMKTDAQLKKDVIEELRWEPSVTASDINVATHNGIVTLSGTGVAPVASLSMPNLGFGYQTLSTASGAMTETVTNTGNGKAVCGNH